VMVESDVPDAIGSEYDGDILVLTSINNLGSGRNDCRNTSGILVTVTVKELSVLSVTGIGQVTVESLNVSELLVEFDGVGDLDMNVTCQKLSLVSNGIGNVNLSGEATSVSYENSGVGDINAYDLKTNDVNISSSAVGNMYVFVGQNLTIRANGVGDIHYQGTPTMKGLHFSGIGSLVSEDGEDLEDEEDEIAPEDRRRK
jgi:hypothetical protein